MGIETKKKTEKGSKASMEESLENVMRWFGEQRRRRNVEGTISCFLCGRDCSVKRDKNNKCYFVCNGCGMQVFVRGSDGMAKLMGKIKVGG